MFSNIEVKKASLNLFSANLTLRICTSGLRCDVEQWGVAKSVVAANLKKLDTTAN
jgi:hypothetical protein